MRIAEKVPLITGEASGIEKAIALLFGQEDAVTKYDPGDGHRPRTTERACQPCLSRSYGQCLVASRGASGEKEERMFLRFRGRATSAPNGAAERDRPSSPVPGQDKASFVTGAA